MEADFRVGEWVVRPRRRLIERGRESVRVKPKSMAVLTRLAGVGGDVVRRNDLFDAVWPGCAVTDDVLTQCIVELRKAFGDTARDSRVIETIPRRGFRLVPPAVPIDRRVATAEAGVGPASRNLSQAVAGLLVLAVAVASVVAGRALLSSGSVAAPAPEKSIAVLPFVDMSPLENQAHFADGLTEELINKLTEIDGLLVTGRTSSFYFKDKHDDLRKIGRTLGVDHILEGSVRKSGESLRVTTQLIDVDTGFHLWSDTYDGPLADVFAVQEEIAEGVADALSVKLQVGWIATQPGGTTNVDAYEQLILGNAMYREFTASAMSQAAEHYQRATDLDPTFAIAWANLADIYRNSRIVLPPDEAKARRQLANRAMERALDLAPDSPYVVITAAKMHLEDGDWAEVERLLRRASNFDARIDIKRIGVFIEYLVKAGRASEAVASVERARRSEPLSSGVAMFLGHLYAMQGRIDEALAEFERGYALQGLRPLIGVEGLVTSLAADDRQAIGTWLERAVEHQQPGALGVHEAMVRLVDDRDAALAFLREGFHDASIPDYYVATWAAYFGEPQLALEALQRSPDPWAYWAPVTATVRGMPGFKTLVRDTGLEAHWREFGWSDFCRPVGPDDFTCR